RLHQRDGGAVIGLGLPRKPRDHVRAKSEHRQPLGEPIEPGAVRLGRIPVATHALEDAVRPRLQGRMEMRGEALRCFDEEGRDRVVDLCGLYRGKPEADGGDGPDEGFDELTQWGRGPVPGPRLPAIRPDM